YIIFLFQQQKVLNFYPDLLTKRVNLMLAENQQIAFCY
ncbi:MAG: hypothetical protein RLZZ44_1662, partial [Bacteroidota bacterium]